MAFTASVTGRGRAGRLRLHTGSYTNTAGSTGGAVATGLRYILFFIANCEVSQAATCHMVARSGGAATITTVADEDGVWFAVGW